jgi:hypothetical protein
MNCTICGKPVVLSPSAAERAAKDNDPSHTAAYYTRLFPTHSDCALNKREQDTRELLRRPPQEDTRPLWWKNQINKERKEQGLPPEFL